MMLNETPNNDGARMCLNHAQSGIENTMGEIDRKLRRWESHAGNHSLRSQLIEDLTDLRWLLDQHFARVSNEDCLERIIFLRPTLYGRFRDVERWQCSLLQRLDLLIDRIRTIHGDSDSIANALTTFQRFHEEILQEECEERQLLELSP